MGVPVHLVPNGHTVRHGGPGPGSGPALHAGSLFRAGPVFLQGGEQRCGEGEESGDGRERVAGEADEVAHVVRAGGVGAETGEEHGMPRPHLHPVDQERGTGLVEHAVDVVHGPGGGAPVVRTRSAAEP